VRDISRENKVMIDWKREFALKKLYRLRERTNRVGCCISARLGLSALEWARSSVG